MFSIQSLLEQIELRCLDGTAIDFDNFTLCFKDGVELDPVSWLSRTENNSSAIIEIFFHRNQQYMFEPLLYPSNVRSRTEPPKPFPSYQTEFTHDEERMGRDSDYGDRIIIRTSPRSKSYCNIDAQHDFSKTLRQKTRLYLDRSAPTSEVEGFRIRR